MQFIGIDSTTSGIEIDCTEEDLSSVIVATTAKAKVELITNIIENVLPEVVFETNFSLSSEENFRLAFNSLADHFDQRPSEGGLTRFKEATNEISVAKNEACTGSFRLNQTDAPQLIREIVDTFRMERKDRHQLRSLYGKLLCVDGIHNRRRRDNRNCECPPNGFDSGFKFYNVCHFFACLDPGDVLKEIFFASDGVQFPCLAFVVDTTGSMIGEINTTKRIILNFLRSEEVIGVDGCYILVPFNDVGPDNADVHDESKTMLCS